MDDVELAAASARAAFRAWSTLPGHVRARHLYSIARHVQKHARSGEMCLCMYITVNHGNVDLQSNVAHLKRCI